MRLAVGEGGVSSANWLVSIEYTYPWTRGRASTLVNGRRHYRLSPLDTGWFSSGFPLISSSFSRPPP